MRALVLACCLLLLAGCTGPQSPGATSSRPPASTASTASRAEGPGGAGCRPPSPISSTAGFPEVHGTSHGLQMWGLMMGGVHGRVRVREDLKIVWRITGHGVLHLATLDPSGRPHRLQWGPDLHGGSNYSRPGEEWGAGYRFARPGCWTLRATRGKASATVWLKVAA